MQRNYQSAHDIAQQLAKAGKEEFLRLQSVYASDSRATVQQALKRAQFRLKAEETERQRVKKLYDFQSKICEGKLCVGLDEVGRGPLAGPLTVGAVVLPETPQIQGINDSKQLSARKREQLAPKIKEVAQAWATFDVSPEDIDHFGMARALRKAFRGALQKIEDSGICPQVVLIDGNPLHIDPREINVVHGDGRCASISCASILAKVTRDAQMVSYAQMYPEYHFDRNKGYGSAEHIKAIQTYGLTPIHRRSFCRNFYQDQLF